MNKLIFITAIGLFGATFLSVAEMSPEDSAKAFVNLLVQQDFLTAESQFDNAMKKALPEEKLKITWNGLLAQTGPFKNILKAQSGKYLDYEIVLVTTEFEKSLIDIKIVFDKETHVSGLFFEKHAEASQSKPAEYKKTDQFEEKEVSVGYGESLLPGTLTIPSGEGPFPGVVLVHGSGPEDRDETIGPNKPFQDLAWGLASRGIAVLRYEKRTKQHPELFAQGKKFSLKEETVDDAIDAVDLLRRTQKIDKDKVFILGHSLGGMMAPRIAFLNPVTAGVIIMAGTTRPLEDVVVQQMSYIFSLDGALTENEKSQLEQIKAQAQKIRELDPAIDPSSDVPLLVSIPAQYWLYLHDYHPAEMAKDLKQPILVLRGERDYQVIAEDFDGWKSFLSTRPDVTFKLYPKLNHLFIEGEKMSTPEDYLIAGHVSDQVIEDISTWIKNIN
jgi:uncharacterized protein